MKPQRSLKVVSNKQLTFTDSVVLHAATYYNYLAHLHLRVEIVSLHAAIYNTYSAHFHLRLKMLKMLKM